MSTTEFINVSVNPCSVALKDAVDFKFWGEGEDLITDQNFPYFKLFSI